MTMTTIYTFDGDKIYAGAVEVDPLGPVPPGTLDAPPDTAGDEVAQWMGSAWVVLPQRPTPAVAVVPPLDRTAISAKIDAEVDALYAAVIGNRAAEYEQAEREAQAYAAADFAGAVPPMVQAWADAKGWTGQQAAQDIIAQAAAWRGAQTQIRAQRLLRKEQVRTAASDDAVHAAVAAWAAALGQIKAALGVV